MQQDGRNTYKSIVDTLQNRKVAIALLLFVLLCVVASAAYGFMGAKGTLDTVMNAIMTGVVVAGLVGLVFYYKHF